MASATPQRCPLASRVRIVRFVPITRRWPQTAFEEVIKINRRGNRRIMPTSGASIRDPLLTRLLPAADVTPSRNGRRLRD
jgi:hypothetical protein